MVASPAALDRAPDDVSADPLRDALVHAVDREYEIVRLIGRGGMGSVYLARDRALERLVAIKVLPPGSATEPDLLERFRREARTVANLQHSGIVPLYAFGEERGLCWFVMGYVRGESLAARLQREGALPADTARTLLAQVADALDHAHRQGVIHRDIKPDNILLDDSTGRALLLDFGIARADSMIAATSLTQVGSVMGTPHYMSPEQASAEPTVDGRADLYSVGVVAYEMLAGRLPFEGRSFRELLIQHVSAAPPPLQEVAPSVPADLADAVMRCLEKDPAQRFPDGASLRAAVGGSAIDEDSLAYELHDLQHAAAYTLLGALIAGLMALVAVIGDGTLFGLPTWFFLLMPFTLLQYVPHVREARARGFSWSDIKRVVTLPPKWWFLWWPRRWRRSTDVWDKLPRLLRLSKYAVTLSSVLLVLEVPIVALSREAVRIRPTDLVPGLHAVYRIRPIAALQALPSLVGLMSYLLLMLGAFTLAIWLARRGVKGYGLSSLDARRAAVKPTDSAFWRDPRIRPMLLATNKTDDRRPTTPQEFVTQILEVARATTPGTARNEPDVPAAARRLLDAILACDKEQAMLDKAAPRDLLERLEAELVLLESEDGDPEALALIGAQRESVIRSRERIVRLHARRADAQARLEALWGEMQRIATGAPAGSGSPSVQLQEIVAQVDADFPPRTRTITARTSAAVLVLILATTSLLAAQSSVATARQLYDRGQADSALAVLASSGDESATRWTLEGLVQLQRAAPRSLFAKVPVAFRARRAFLRAVALDSTAVDALEQLVWMHRLMPWAVGGSRAKSIAALEQLEAQAPYRAELLRGYLAWTDKQYDTALLRFRNLTEAAPDSAGAWFALGDLAARQNRLDEARTGYARYRELRRDDRAVLYHIGVLSAQHGVDLAAGEAALRSYIAAPLRMDEPVLDLAWWRLGQVLEKQGRDKDAEQAYREAVRLDPGYSEYKASLARLLEARE